MTVTGSWNNQRFQASVRRLQLVLARLYVSHMLRQVQSNANQINWNKSKKQGKQGKKTKRGLITWFPLKNEIRTLHGYISTLFPKWHVNSVCSVPGSLSWQLFLTKQFHNSTIENIFIYWKPYFQLLKITRLRASTAPKLKKKTLEISYPWNNAQFHRLFKVPIFKPLSASSWSVFLFSSWENLN